MRKSLCVAAVLCCTIGGAAANPGDVDPSTFATKAKFSVDQTALSLSTSVATVEPRTGAPGYSWVRIYFYSFPVTAEDVAGAKNGDVSSMEKRWNKLAGTPPSI